MASTGLNVARYSALGFGIIYGLYHQATLTTSAKLAASKKEYEHKQKLIDQAKAEYTKLKSPPSQKTGESGGVVRDPNNSRFDLEAYLNAIDAESK